MLPPAYVTRCCLLFFAMMPPYAFRLMLLRHAIAAHADARRCHHILIHFTPPLIIILCFRFHCCCHAIFADADIIEPYFRDAASFLFFIAAYYGHYC